MTVDAQATPCFELDLCRSIEPVNGLSGASAYHARIAPPGAPLDVQRGLAMPVDEGGLAFESRGRFDDARGTLQIVFEPASDHPDGALVHAMGQYPPMVSLHREGLLLRVYQHELRMQVNWQAERVYTLRISWDHTAGIVLELQPDGGERQCLRRRCVWQAFSIQTLPLCIGGNLAGRPVFTEWTGTFHGYVRQVRLWDQPLAAPPAALSVAHAPQRGGAADRAALPPHDDVTLLALNDPPIIESPHRADTITPALEDLRKTRAAAEVETLVARSDDEWQLFIRLTHMVSRLWPHTHYWPWPEREQRHLFWKRGHEMFPAIRAGEMHGMCGGYAHVMEELFWSLGFDARRIQTFSHSSFEAYSNQHDRWVLLDASHNRNAHCFFDAAGLPLNIADLVRRHEQLEHDPAAFDDVRCAIVQADGSTQTSELPLARQYTYAGIGLGDPNPGQGAQPHVWYFSPHDRAAAELIMRGAGRVNHRTDRLDDLYWSCQRTQVSLNWATPGDTLAVSAQPHQAALHAHMERQVDRGAWERCEPTFAWPLHPGVNELAVRTRNALGATGQAWRMQLWKRPV